jgi:hypothetical protein
MNLHNTTKINLAKPFLLLLIAFLLFSGDIKIINAQAPEGKIIKIEASDNKTLTGIIINPDKISVKKDTILIWLNSISGHDINIIFEDRKKLEKSIADPMGFSINSRGYFSADYLPHIATASLRFIKPGSYSYSATSRDGKVTANGTIVVF